MTTQRIRSIAAAAIVGGFAALIGVGGFALAKTTKAELRAALNDEQLVGDWNYDDIDQAFVRAGKDGRPVCVVFR